LQPATEQGEQTSKDNSLSSSELVPESPTNETAKHGTEIIDRDQASLLGGVGNFSVRSNADSLDVPCRPVHKTHNPLVVTFEDQGQG
jgi:hypothetical protein